MIMLNLAFCNILCLGESGKRNGPAVVEFIRSTVGASRQQAGSHEGCRKGAVDDTGEAAVSCRALCFREEAMRMFCACTESALSPSRVRLREMGEGFMHSSLFRMR